jgi:aryl-alcohol dehydrogenase-like predicted oxidoreductase
MNSPMPYRRLGRSGLQVSALSLGSWVTYHNQVDSQRAQAMLGAAMDAGINFFDNAEVYANSESETIMGAALRKLGRPRLDDVVSTKFFWGLDRAKPGQPPRIDAQDTLNRKDLMQAMDGALKRLSMDFVDFVFCHRPDPHTPIEETVRAFDDLITQGKLLYWGTSE